MKRDTKEHNRLVNQSDAILYFLQRMDIEMINDILDDGRTYQGFGKSLFIHKLGNAFDEFIEEGDSFLSCYNGFCNSETCNYNCSGFSLIGNHSKNYLNLIIEIKEGIVHDMYECSKFRISKNSITRRNRIRINRFDTLF